MKKTLIFASAIAATSLIASPVLAADGEALFNKSCKMCHTADNAKIGATTKNTDKDKLIAAMTTGGPKAMNKKVASLSDEERTAIADYLLSANQ